jgi:hypothetical protein
VFLLLVSSRQKFHSCPQPHQSLSQGIQWAVLIGWEQSKYYHSTRIVVVGMLWLVGTSTTGWPACYSGYLTCSEDILQVGPGASGSVGAVLASMYQELHYCHSASSCLCSSINVLACHVCVHLSTCWHHLVCTLTCSTPTTALLLLNCRLGAVAVAVRRWCGLCSVCAAVLQC